jgi:hypothetical protein
MALVRSSLLFCVCLSYAMSFQCPEHERIYGETECQCEAGYSRQGADCVACPMATFKESSGDRAENADACAALSGCCACPINTNTLAPAAVHSSSCLCLPGYGGPACLPCSLGWYKTSTGTEECKPCPAGASTVQLRSSAAEDCIAARGFYGNLIVGFSKCPKGSYAPTVGMSTCIQCPVGATSAEGAISHEECHTPLKLAADSLFVY